MLEAGRNHYILVLIRALEKRAMDGGLDEALADHIEKLLGVGKPDAAGEAEFASWRPHGVRVDGGLSREHAELMLLAAADLESWMKSYHRDGATEATVKRLRDTALDVPGTFNDQQEQPR